MELRLSRACTLSPVRCSSFFSRCSAVRRRSWAHRHRHLGADASTTTVIGQHQHVIVHTLPFERPWHSWKPCFCAADSPAHVLLCLPVAVPCALGADLRACDLCRCASLWTAKRCRLSINLCCILVQVLPPEGLQSLLAPLMPALMAKAADNIQRMREQTQSVLLDMAHRSTQCFELVVHHLFDDEVAIPPS